MSIVGSEESLRDEIEKVRSKLSGTSSIDIETRECSKMSLNDTEEIMLAGPGEMKQTIDHPTLDSNVLEPFHKEERLYNGSEKTATGNDTGGICQKIQKSETSQNSAPCEIGRQLESPSVISSAFYVENNIQGFPPKPKSYSSKQKIPDYPLTAVEVSVSGHQQGDQSGTADLGDYRNRMVDVSNEMPRDEDSGCNRLCRRADSNSTKPTYNLSKAPISLITLKTANNGLCTCGEMLFNKADRLKASLTLKTEGKETTESAHLGVTVHPKSHLQTLLVAEAESRELTLKDKSSETKVLALGEKRPAVGRRLSKTIQHLQEKLQKEIQDNGSKAWKEDDRPGKTTESKRIFKTNNRFVRERSRRRSKSRVGYKVLQSARKYPHAITKERPYRQWMGVGNCVSNDMRFIVSSNSSPDSKCLLQCENSSRKGDGENTMNLYNDLPCKNKVDTKDSSDQLESSKNEERGLDVVPKPWTIVGATGSCLSDSLRNNCPNSIAREGARGARRSSLRPDRRVRPPTPHSDFTRENENAEKTPLNTVKPQRTSRKGSISGVLGIDTRAPSVSKNRLTPNEFGRYSPRLLSNETSPSKFEFDYIVRSSKLFTAAARQQRKHSRTAYLRSKNTDAPKNHAGKSVTSNISQISSRGGNLATSEETPYHGSMETLWSDVSTTTGESSTRTESSSSWYCKDISGNHDNTSREQRHCLSSPEERLTLTGYDFTKRVFEARGKDRGVYNRKYVDVQAVVDFKGSLPGQLSFHKGQIIRQLVSSSKGSAEDMSYGYYRTGALKRKKKGLFPSACVTPLPL